VEIPDFWLNRFFDKVFTLLNSSDLNIRFPHIFSLNKEGDILYSSSPVFGKHSSLFYELLNQNKTTKYLVHG